MTAGYGNGVGDPSGAGSGLSRSQRLDGIGPGVPADQNRDHWVDKSSFLCPGRGVGPAQFNCRVGINPATDPVPIGRFGNSGVGYLEGPGTVNLSMSPGTVFPITETAPIRLSGSFTNLPNHVNLS